MPSIYFVGFIWCLCTTSANCMWKMAKEQFPELVTQHFALKEKKTLEQKILESYRHYMPVELSSFKKMLSHSNGK